MGGVGGNDVMRCAALKILACVGFVALGQMGLKAQLYLVDPSSATNSPANPLVGLVWNPSPDPVAGYLVCWGLESGHWPNVLDVGDVTSVVLGGLASNTTYYFTLVAYNAVDNRSEPSEEVQYPPPDANPTPAAPEGFFRLTPLVSFEGTDGANPYGGLTLGTEGSFYGTTTQGGGYGYGTGFKVTPSGALTTVYSFSSYAGINPYADLVRGADGNLFGAGSGGGIYSLGTLFRMTPGGLVDYITLAYGANPRGALLEYTDGTFYGTTAGGGANGLGTFYNATTNGALTTLFSFNAASGAHPQGSLALGTDGNFYGTTYDGGVSGFGTIFRVTRAGVLSNLYNFRGNGDGANPYAGLVRGADGYFYGSTYGGGTNGLGIVFCATPSGTVTNLHSFVGSDGAHPFAGPIQDPDGNLYGTTWAGGLNTNGLPGYGTVFKLMTNGTLTTLYAFAGGIDGANPAGRLLRSSDGHLYGTTVNGGAAGKGTVFRLSYVPIPSVRSMMVTRDNFAVSWNASLWQNYQVQYSTNLVQGRWMNWGTPIIATNISMSVTFRFGPEPSRFYRVVLGP